MTEFGIAFLQQALKQSTEANTVISPYSLYAVLAMARTGAQGNSAAQLDQLLGVEGATQRQVMTAIDAALKEAMAAGAPIPTRSGRPDSGDEREFTVHSANSLWKAPGLTVRQEFLDDLSAGFGAGLHELDFAADPELARTIINEWVAEQTAEMIPNLIANLDPATQLALVNAVYLQAPWAESFIPAELQNFNTGTEKVTVPGMINSGEYRYTAGDGWSSVQIPYRGGEMAMSIILPDVGSEGSVAASLDAVLAESMSQAGPESVSITMPKFKINTVAPAKDIVQSLGVTDIFASGAADFSGITGGRDLVADQLIHQAIIEVDENGTKAAAATAMTMVPTSARAVEWIKFTVDRPFYFVVHDTTTNAPLFVGQVSNPLG